MAASASGSLRAQLTGDQRACVLNDRSGLSLTFAFDSRRDSRLTQSICILSFMESAQSQLCVDYRESERSPGCIPPECSDVEQY
jgi:hypothetical protein